jgi:hypothetical protein
MFDDQYGLSGIHQLTSYILLTKITAFVVSKVLYTSTSNLMADVIKHVMHFLFKQKCLIIS